MDFSYSEQQLEIKRGIRDWCEKNLTEEVIAAGYKNRGRQALGQGRLGPVRSA